MKSSAVFTLAALALWSFVAPAFAAKAKLDPSKKTFNVRDYGADIRFDGCKIEVVSGPAFVSANSRDVTADGRKF